MKRVLVFGAGGAQGGAVAQLLLEKGIEVRALVNKTDQTQQVADAGAELAVADLANPESLIAAMAGVSHVSLVFPLLYDWPLMRQYAENVAQALTATAPELVVFNTSVALPPARSGSTAMDIKLDILEKLQQTGLPLITLIPSFYLDNLTGPWSLPMVKEQGIISYPLPANTPFAWLSHKNLAMATYSALSKPELAGQLLPLGAPLATGQQIANALTKVAGKTVQYVYQQPEDFKKVLMYQFTEEVAGEIADLYANIAQHTEPFQQFFQPEIMEKVLGLKLQTLEEWASVQPIK